MSMLYECQCNKTVIVEKLPVQCLILSHNSFFLASINTKLTIFDLRSKTNKQKPLVKLVNEIQFFQEKAYVLYHDHQVEIINVATFNIQATICGVQELYLNEKTQIESYLTQSAVIILHNKIREKQSRIQLKRNVKKSQKLSIITAIFQSKTFMYIMNHNCVQIVNISEQKHHNIIDLNTQNFLKVIKINYHPRLINNKLQVFDIIHSPASLVGPDSFIRDVICPDQIFEHSQIVFLQVYQIMAVYSRLKQTLCDITFSGKKIQVLRRYYVGIDIKMFRYGTNNNIGLFLFNNLSNVESIKLGENNVIKKVALPQKQKQKKKTKVLQRQSKTIKPSSQPSVNNEKIEIKPTTKVEQQQEKKEQVKDIKQEQQKTQTQSVKVEKTQQINNTNDTNNVNNVNISDINNTNNTGKTDNIDNKDNTCSLNNNNTQQNIVSQSSNKVSSENKNENETKIEHSQNQVVIQSSSQKLQKLTQPPQDKTQITTKQSLTRQGLKSNTTLEAFSESLKQKLISASKLFKTTIQAQSRKLQQTLKTTTDSLKQQLKKEVVQQSKAQIMNFISTQLHQKLQKYFQQIFLKINQTYQSGHKFSEAQYALQKQKYDAMSVQIVDKRFESLQNLLHDIKDFLQNKDVQSQDISGFQTKIQHLIVQLKNTLDTYNQSTNNRQKIDKLLQQKMQQLSKIVQYFRQKQQDTQQKQVTRKRTDSSSSNKFLIGKDKKFYVIRRKDN